MANYKIKRITSSAMMGIAVASVLTTAVFFRSASAEPPAAPPDGQNGSGDAPGGTPGGLTSGSVSHTGVTTLSADTSLSDASYSSSNAAEHALLIDGGTVTLINPTVNKTGDTDGDEADFYGTNAAVFAHNGATLNINGGSITTNGSHANAVFAYGNGVINISDATIDTSSNNSGGVMVTGGGTLNGTNLTVHTTGNSSAAIRSDRGGGNLTVTGGTFDTDGVGSPAIYSTANIVANNTILRSTASEGVVIEGKNSVSIDGTTITDTNNTLNGNSETYKNIFIYQSMSGDADEGVGSFTAKNSKITTNNGDTFFVTNTTAEINLENNNIINQSGDFLRVQAGKWGNSGSNGGVVTLTTSAQEVVGGIVVDNISSVTMKMSNDSYYKGKLNADNTASNLALELDDSSVVVLTADAYVSSLTNALADNSNIYGNGFKLYVAGAEVAVNTAEAPGGRKNGSNQEALITAKDAGATDSTDSSSENEDHGKAVLYICTAVGVTVLLAIIGAVIAVNVKKNREKNAMKNGGQPETGGTPNVHPGVNPGI